MVETWGTQGRILDDRSGQASLILLRSRGRTCALPAEHVVETMRPLAYDAMPGAPPCVLGVAVIRGEPTVVVDVGVVLDTEATPGAALGEPSARFVTVKAGARTVALLVDAVLGLRPEPRATVGALPPMLRGARGDVVARIATLDAELLFVLECARLVPDVAPRLAVAAERSDA
jgi:purine-binding chemotaxis protein CheW